MTRGWLTAVVLVASFAWGAAILLAPAAVAARQATPAILPILAAATYSAGHVVCHQRPERSFRLAGQPMPVCARCAGLYLAAPLAFGLFAWGRPGATRLRGWLLVAAAPTAASVIVEAATGMTAAPLRAAAGALLGIGLARLLAAWVAEPPRRTPASVLLH